jgi:hypothetical protein
MLVSLKLRLHVIWMHNDIKLILFLYTVNIHVLCLCVTVRSYLDVTCVDNCSVISMTQGSKSC